MLRLFRIDHDGVLMTMLADRNDAKGTSPPQTKKNRAKRMKTSRRKRRTTKTKALMRRVSC
jgi:hypothetical protein